MTERKRTEREREDLIEAEELGQGLHAANLVVLDVRFDLADPTAGERAYREGHIPGAVFLDLERDLAAPRGPHGGRHPLPTVQHLEAVFGRAGVGPASEVVVYDEDGMYAPHAWWLLRYLGHDRVRVLNGGLNAWRTLGLPLETQVPRVEARRFVAHPHTEWVAEREEVEHLGKDRILIDARAPERYRGEYEPIDPRAGHIPDAVNAFWKEGLDDEGRWRGAEEQKRRFAFAEGAREIIAYCGSGVTACSDLFALHLAGRTGRVYHGSFSDWASYPDLPVIAESGKSEGTRNV